MSSLDPKHHPFEVAEDLSFEEIKAYLDGSLTEQEKHAIELKIQSSAFNAMALEGYRQQVVNATDIEKLQRKIDYRSRSWLNNYFIWGLSSLLVIAVAGFIFLHSKDEKKNASAVVSDKPINAEKTDSENFYQPVTITLTMKDDDLNRKQPTANRKRSGLDSSQTQPIHKELTEAIPPKILSHLPSTGISSPELMLPDYNAPVIYIEHLKVTHYRMFYFLDNQDIDPSNTQSNIENHLCINPDHGNPEWKESAVDILKDALSAFNRENWTKCISRMEKLEEINNEDLNAHFYMGVCNYHLNRPLQAIQHLAVTRNNAVNSFREESEWYYALSLLLIQDNGDARKEAEDLLKKIMQRKGFYALSAQKKLEELQH